MCASRAQAYEPTSSSDERRSPAIAVGGGTVRCHGPARHRALGQQTVGRSFAVGFVWLASLAALFACTRALPLPLRADPLGSAPSRHARHEHGMLGREGGNAGADTVYPRARRSMSVIATEPAKLSPVAEQVRPPAYPRLPGQVYAKPEAAGQLASVVGFTLGRPGFGEVAFDVAGFNVTDIRGLDLRGVLRWGGSAGRMTSVTLYPDAATKPQRGTQLNKPATVTVRAWLRPPASCLDYT